uniref:NLR family, pyrin domain containing 10 n=1 Tax=Jaculus jaculus TaxID=51337 RepID=A0A8C5JZC7_JACJA
MASALSQSPQEALLWALSDLEENSFKTLKFHLRAMTQPHLARGELERLSRVDLASRLILMYGAQEAVRVVLKVLKIMNLLELVDQLSQVHLNDYREIYREHVRSLAEEDQGVKGSFNRLLLVAAEPPAGPGLEQELHSVGMETLFGPGEEPHPSVVVLQGSAGTGKTTLVKNLVQEWARGALYPDRFDYVFYVSCREVVLLPRCDLHQLLFWCCGDSQAPATEILRQPERLLFILDGYDELQRPFEEHCMEKVLHLLIRRRLLPTCSLLITTRPPALRNLQSMLGDQHHVHVHILGFSEEERKRYFDFYFADEERARKAFGFVQKSAILYKACQVPGICWVLCSWLKAHLDRGQEVSEPPSNSTDIYTAYVSTFLPADGDGDCSDLTRYRVLKGLCSLAAEGIQHHRLLFKEDDLKRHNLDGPRLTAFLSSSEYQEGLGIKKFYSFRHISFQEFFHAMSFLMKEDQNQLGEETRREVDRLLEVKDQEEYEEVSLSMQFLFDILKTDSALNWKFKNLFKTAPSLMQDLKHFKEQMECAKHHWSWELEFSLYESKIKKLTKGFQMKDILFKIDYL